MIANSNPSSNQEAGNSSSGLAYTNSATLQALKNDPGLSFEWSAEEQSILEDELNKHSTVNPPLRYAKIALLLQGKTMRDVALRCKWMTTKENAKKRKDDHIQSRKNRDKKERISDSSTKATSDHLVARPSVHPYSLPVLSLVDDDDDISFSEIGGLPGQLLEVNSNIFKQLSGQLPNIQENLALLSQARNNILSILNVVNDMPAIMTQMPPLPVKINEELAASILPRI